MQNLIRSTGKRILLNAKRRGASIKKEYSARTGAVKSESIVLSLMQCPLRES